MPCSHLARAFGLYIVYMLIFAGFGAGSDLGLFTHTSAGVQIVAYILWFHSMWGLASWMAVFYEVRALR